MYLKWLGPWEAVVIEGDNITPSLLVWRRYKRPAAGVLENMLDMNPDLIELLSQSPYFPVGAIVRVPIDQAAISGAPRSVKQVTLWGAE
jgi:phage tail protein X